MIPPDDPLEDLRALIRNMAIILAICLVWACLEAWALG